MLKRTLRIIWQVSSIASVLLGLLGILRMQSDLALWQDALKNMGMHPGLLFVTLLGGGLLLGEGLRSIIKFTAALGKKYSNWLRSEDIAWGLQVRGFMRNPGDYMPPDPKFQLNWKTASVRAPWSDRIDRGTEPVWLAVAFASRSSIHNRFRIRTPVAKHRLDDWTALFGKYETRDLRLGHRAGDKFFKYRIPKTGGYSGPIPLDPVLKGDYTQICDTTLGYAGTLTAAFEIADIDCMRELFIAYTFGNTGVAVRFARPGRLTTIPDTDDRNRAVRKCEGIRVKLSKTDRIAERGCILLETVEAGSLECVLAFRQAPLPNKNPRFVDELVIVASDATRGSLTVYWK